MVSPADPTAEGAAGGPLFAPTYKLIGYCLLVGVLGGLAAIAFDKLVDLAQVWLLEGVGGYRPLRHGVLSPEMTIPALAERWWLPVVTTLGGLASGLLVYWLAPEAGGPGTDAAIVSYHRQGGVTRRRAPFVKGLASALTIGSGGVAGREGPTAQIAVGLGGLVTERLALRGQERRILILAAMAAGPAAMFQAPLGMAIFAVEILYAGMVFESEALLYTVISAVTAYSVRGVVDGWSPIFAIPDGLSFEAIELPVYAVLGVAAGALGAVLPPLFYRTRDLFARLPGPPHLRPALGGLMVGLLALAVPQVLGTGYGWVELAFSGELPLLTLGLLLVLKGPAMAVTVGSGGSGGVFGPTIVLGALLGAAVGTLGSFAVPVLGFEPAPFVVVGMAAVFAGAARTPLSTLIMVAEMTGGYALIVPTMLAVMMAFVVQRTLTASARYPTLYENQVQSREDSPVHRGVFVRRAMQMLDGGAMDASEISLPRLVSLLSYGEPVPVADGPGMLVTVAVAEGSGLDGRTVAEGVGRLSGTTAVAVMRQGEMVIPRGPTVLAAGDQLIAIATPPAAEALRQAAEPPGPPRPLGVGDSAGPSVP